jgi:hypothetical protein
VRGWRVSSHTSKVNTSDRWQDEQSHKANAPLVRPLTSNSTHISLFSIPVYLPSSPYSLRHHHHDDRLTNEEAESCRDPHAGEAIRMTFLCSITARQFTQVNNDIKLFTVATRTQTRTKASRAAVITSARTEHHHLKPASRYTNFHKTPQPSHPLDCALGKAMAAYFLCSRTALDQTVAVNRHALRSATLTSV